MLSIYLKLQNNVFYRILLKNLDYLTKFKAIVLQQTQNKKLKNALEIILKKCFSARSNKQKEVGISKKYLKFSN